MTFAEALDELISQFREYTADDIEDALADRIPEPPSRIAFDDFAMEWRAYSCVIDDLASARRCLNSPNRGPSESLLYVERAEARLINAERSPW